MDYIESIDWKGGDRWKIEKQMILWGGRKGGIGEGLEYHWKAAMSVLWPHWEWHKWSNLLIDNFLQHDEIGVLGPASSGKTYCAAAYGLMTFFVWPRGTSIIVSSTTREGLQLRIWGAIKELFNKAKVLRPELPGQIRESHFMLSDNPEDQEGRDFRDGVIGVACRVGGVWVGISNYVGVKNDRVILIADEASLMERGFLDAVANLRKNPMFKLIAMGNPKDRFDALGVVAEPAADIGGWEGYDGATKTQTWKTRARNGVAVQLCGTESPNFDHPRGKNPYKGLITPEQIEADLAYYGERSLQFSMMNLGVMPGEASNRRVITMSLCERKGAFGETLWSGESMTHVVGFDAAYRGVGGDRAVLTHLVFGKDNAGVERIAFAGPQLIAPIDGKSPQTAEEQLAMFCRDYCLTKGVSPENFGLDSTGRGTLVSALGQLWSPAVVPVEFGGRPAERQMCAGDPKMESQAYGKQVSALWFASYYVINSGQLRLCPREAAEEGCLREWCVNPNRTARSGEPVVDVEPKEKTKQRMGRSPDLWDSFVVALEVARRRGFMIAGTLGVITTKRKSPSWLSRQAQLQEKMRKNHALVYG
jgi:hypothetical protein